MADVPHQQPPQTAWPGEPSGPYAPSGAPVAPPTPTQPRGFVGFMTTVPGVLTALAGVVTALGTAWIGLASHNPPAPLPPNVVTTTVTPSAPPPEVSSADTGSLRLDNGGDLAIGGAGTSLEEQCIAGDSSACTQLLVYLVQECSDGYGASCDELYLVSPVGSALENYGATCGYLFSPDVAGTCEEQ